MHRISTLCEKTGVLHAPAVNAAMAALLGALGRRGSGPAVLERLLHAPGAAIGARLVHVGSHQHSAEQAAEADGMDVTQMDSGTLQVRQCWARASRATPVCPT